MLMKYSGFKPAYDKSSAGRHKKALTSIARALSTFSQRGGLFAFGRLGICVVFIPAGAGEVFVEFS